MSEFIYGESAEKMALAVCGVCRPPDAIKKPLVKLPPVFNSESSVHLGRGAENILAMVRVIIAYQDKFSGAQRLTLEGLPALYNQCGGLPLLAKKDVRRVHNWMLQVTMALRAAVIMQEENRALSAERAGVAERAFCRLYEQSSSPSFVTWAPESRYEIKPLRGGGKEFVMAWIRQECQQARQWKSGKLTRFGALPSEAEWEVYGVRCQMKTAMNKFAGEIEQMMGAAQDYEGAGAYSQADCIESCMSQMCQQFSEI